MHRAVDMGIWQGRIDEEPEGGKLRWHQCIEPLGRGSFDPGVVLLGVCSDEGVRVNLGRIGARDGPDAIRKAMANQAWHLQVPFYDGGNLYCDEGGLEGLFEAQATIIEAFLEAGHYPILLGGGHEMSYGSFCGLIGHLRTSDHEGPVGIINFDAHFDMRSAVQPGSGTAFLQIAEYCGRESLPFNYFCLGVSEVANTETLFNRARVLGVDFLKDEELVSWNLVQSRRRLGTFIDRCAAIHLSIDLDVFPASVAPGVSAPAPRGVSLEIVEHLIDFIKVRAQDKLKLADIAEYNPKYDSDGRTAKVAARLCHLLARDVDGAAEGGENRESQD